MSELACTTAPSIGPAARRGEEDTEAALRPVGAELLRRAAADADAIVATARADARAAVTDAQEQAAAITERARTAGVARAATHRAAEQRRLRREQRAALLAAQRDVYDQWRRQGAAAVLRLSAEPDWQHLRDLLRAKAIQLLGPEAEIVADPAGGFVARYGGRRLDLRLSTVAARALDTVEPELTGLWT